MRSCPFCSADNTRELAVCHRCGRRLPPLPPRFDRPRSEAPPLPPAVAVRVPLGAHSSPAEPLASDVANKAAEPLALAVVTTPPEDRKVENPNDVEKMPSAIALQLEAPFVPPKVIPVPGIPEPGLVMPARYAYLFARAWWQRRFAAKQLTVEIKQHTQVLDGVLGELGRAARDARVEGRVFSAENSALSSAEARILQLGDERLGVESRKAEEHAKFSEVERERMAKLTEAERVVDEVAHELATLEAHRRGLRDRRKELERQGKASRNPAADPGPVVAGSAPGDSSDVALGSTTASTIESELLALERPIHEIAARLDASKAELDAAKRSLHDAREGHSHRLAELDAEHKRKSREIASSEAEIARRLVTLGTLVNLNRIEGPQFDALYRNIDLLRTAITARTTEVEKLTAEREAYDAGTLVRGIAIIAGAALALTAVIVIVLAVL